MYTEKQFPISGLTGISDKTIEEHKKLYTGYVKHTNLIQEKVQELSVDTEKNAYLIGELQRRYGFEFDGMRNHEYYFENLVGPSTELGTSSSLMAMIETTWGSFDAWLTRFKAIAMTRGIGWAVLYYDAVEKKLINTWVEEQHLGQLNGAHFILGLDMWEHSYMLDYVPSEKKKYVEAFFANLNCNPSEERFVNAIK
jgi:Fe-Mn family superoxide dismutase